MTAQPPPGSPVAAVVTLTAEQKTVVAAIARGDSRAQIARQLGVSDDIIRRIIGRLGLCLVAHTDSAITAAAYRHRILTPPPRAQAGTVTLTRRVAETLRLIAAGHSTTAAAQALWVTTETVHAHLRTAFAQLGARNRAHAVAIAYDTGLLPIPQPLPQPAARRSA
jgi:DNA-binding CsgD family transcriptional regulator